VEAVHKKNILPLQERTKQYKINGKKNQAFDLTTGIVGEK